MRNHHLTTRNPRKAEPINCALRLGRGRKQDATATGWRTPQDTHFARTAGRNRYARAFDPTAPAHVHQAQRRDYQRSVAATRERHLAATRNILNPHMRNAPPDQWA